MGAVVRVVIVLVNVREQATTAATRSSVLGSGIQESDDSNKGTPANIIGLD